jgi:hypothetical protein
MLAAKVPRYRYQVDSTDLIVWVDEWWLAFAKENGAPGLTKELVLGRSLWDFVAGDELCQLYMEMHTRVRQSGRPAILPFRCDSPWLQRHMRLTISLGSDGRLSYDSVLVRAVPQSHLEVIDSGRPRSAATLDICSCCRRALLEPAGWMDLEDVSVQLQLFEGHEVPTLHHTVCPECAYTLQSVPSKT